MLCFSSTFLQAKLLKASTFAIHSILKRKPSELYALFGKEVDLGRRRAAYFEDLLQAQEAIARLIMEKKDDKASSSALS